MGINCAPLVADLFLFCYERDFIMSLSDDKQADVIDAFKVVRDPCQKITLLLLKSKSVRVIVPESCF